jgi:serine/threonine-protein kinase
MGVVMAGHQLNLDRPVAIKFLHPSQLHGVRPTRRFEREAMAIAKMQSEHVVRVFDAGQEGGSPFIVMERLVGHDLASELIAGPLPSGLAVSYLLEACEAIAEAHALGIVHRDVKPSNLFIARTAKGRKVVKVLDFGISKWLGPRSDLELSFATGEHGFVGTPAYVSPEQLTHPEDVDARADIWALGVVLYQCLCGKLPFAGDSVAQLTAAILSDEPSEFSSSSDIPAPLRTVVERCLAKDPAKRFTSVLELARALLPFAGVEARHRPGWPELTDISVSAPGARRHVRVAGHWRWALILVLLGGLVSLGSLVIGWTRGSEPHIATAAPVATTPAMQAPPSSAPRPSVELPRHVPSATARDAYDNTTNSRVLRRAPAPAPRNSAAPPGSNAAPLGSVAPPGPSSALPNVDVGRLYRW